MHEQSSITVGKTRKGDSQDDHTSRTQTPIETHGKGQGEEVAEEWRPIPKREGYYEVSNLGRVRSLRLVNRFVDRPRIEPKILSNRVHPDGYVKVVIAYPGRQCKQLGRIVLEAFGGPIPEGYEAAHQNGNRGDNRASNLKWMSPSENCRQRAEHGTQPQGERVHLSKLKDHQVKEIRRLFAEQILTTRQIAKRFGISRQNAHSIKIRETWKHI